MRNLNKPKLTFENLVVETTRRCNMKCAHCLRGDAQEVDIDYKHIDNLLDQIEAVGYLEITGGEPTLNLDGLKYLLNGLCKRGIPLFSFSLFTNGLVYSEEFINIIKQCKRIIDVSCSNCLTNGNEYQPQKAISRCAVGISLDRYHEKHDICMEHYKKYKAALSGYADVRMIMQGNNLQKIGRAKNLPEALDIDFNFDFSQKQRIEILSKDYVPACRDYAAYHMFHEDQKIICCRVGVDVYGNISNECGIQWDWESNDSYPKICNVNDSIWDSLIEYNKDKIPCAKYKDLLLEKAQKELPAEETAKWLINPDAKNEPMHYEKMMEAELEEKFEKLAHPQNFFEALDNVVKEYKNYVAAQKNLQRAKEHEAKDWKQIAAEAAHHCYYDGDKRGNAKRQTSTNQIRSLSEVIQQTKVPSIMPAKKDSFGLRCFWCGKVIQTPEGRNIHCVPEDQGLECQYCHSVNTVENTAVTNR